MTCHCGRPMSRIYHSFYATWMWKCPQHGLQTAAEMSDRQLSLVHEKGWR